METEEEYQARLDAYNVEYAARVAANGLNVQYSAPITVDNLQIKAMNPSHIIYECLTNREWGRGFDRALINTASFIACAEQLYAEQFGLCLRWSRKDSIENFVQSILDHIGAAIYPERETSLLTLKLIRGDYVRSELPLFDMSNGLLSIPESTTSTSGSTINEIQVKYRDPVTNEDRIVKAQNLASIQSSAGAINSMSKSYPGLPTQALARRIAQRDLRANAEGLRRFKFVFDRRAWKIRPGHVFRIQDVSRKIPDMVVRAATVEDGTLVSGKITITALQDVFSLPGTSFTAGEPAHWTRPNSYPCVGRHRVFELPYFLLQRAMSASDFAFIEPTSSYVGVVAEQGQAANTSYSLAVRDTAPTSDDTPANGDAYCGYVPAGE